MADYVKEIFIKLGLDADAASFASAQTVVDGLETGIEKLGEAVEWLAHGFIKLIEETTHSADRIDELSQSTGVNREALQQLGYAARFSNMSLEDMAQAMHFLGKTGVKDVKAEMFKLADQFHKMPNSGAKAKLAMEKFGRAGARLIPLLNEGGDKLRAFAEEADTFGVTLGNDTVDSGVKFADTIESIKGVLEGLRNLIAGPLLDDLTALGQEFIGWVSENRVEIVAFAKEVIAFAKGAVKFMWQALKNVASTLRTVVKLWKIFAVVLGSAVAVAIATNIAAVASAAGWYAALSVASVVAAVKAAAAWMAAALPVTILIALIAALVLIAQDVYTFLQGGDSVLGRLGPKWTKFLDEWITEPSDWWLIRQLKAALKILTDLDGAARKLFKGPEVKFDPNFKPTEGNGLKTDSVWGSLKRAAGFEIDASKFYTPNASFGGGASPAATAAVQAAGVNNNSKSVSNIYSPNINVKVEGNGDVDQIAGAVRAQVEEHHKAVMRETAAALE